MGSHVLSSAWRCITNGAGESSERLLVPCLVTGVKIWHLREKSTFYTKFAFWERITSLPAGADVVLILGEIDCREGILKAVQKGRYASIHEAVVSLVDLYVKVVQEVRRRLPRGEA